MKNIKLLFASLLAVSVLLYCGGADVSLTESASKNANSGNDKVHFNNAFGGKDGMGTYMSVKTDKEFNKLVGLVSSNLKKLNPKNQLYFKA